MPRDNSGDRPKRSWREIDQNKDRSGHRAGDKPAMGKWKQERADNASKLYKSKLDNFFDGDGKIPKHLKEKFEALETTSPDGKKRVVAIKKIKDANTSTAIEKAIADYLGKWEMPPDHEVLAQALSSGDEDHVEQALELIGVLLDANRAPRHTAIMEQRLKRIISMGEDPDLEDKARELVRKLRLFS